MSLRYKQNPFLEGMVVPVKNRAVKLNKLGCNDSVLIDNSTGELMGTHLTTYRKVDGEQFVKLFTANIGLTFDLTAAGIKAFGVVMWAVQHSAISKDEISMDSFTLADFLEANTSKKLSLATFKRGLNELENAQILAKTLRKGRYFINPNFIFNGDRIAFTTLIERTAGDEHLQDQLI